MRESLTIFAIALIVVLSALLVGPYLVDWNNQRDWLSAKLSSTIGAKVRIAGPIDVKLLPRPIFRINQVSVEGASPQDPKLSAATLDAELSINSLLQGAVEFVDADVTAPQIEMTTRDDGSLIAPTWDVSNPKRFMFRRVILHDGSVSVKDERGRQRFAVTGIAAQGEADTLFGPLKLAGEAKGPKGAVKFRLSTGAYGGRRMRVRLIADANGPVSHADIDGVMSAGTAAKPAPLGFDGALTASGALRVADGAAPIPWQVTATNAKADDRQISTTSLELRAGLDGRALVASGEGLLGLVGAPSLVLKLRARQLDLDNIAVPPEVAPDTPRPKPAQTLAYLQGLVGPEGAGTTLQLRLSMDYAIDAVTSGDLTLTDAVGSLEAIKGVPIKGRFAINGPSASRLALDGTVETGAGAVFKGHVEAATRDLDAVASWIDPLAPGAATWIRHYVPVRAIELTGALDLSKTGVVARDARLALEGSTVSGTIALTEGQDGAPARLFADVTADTLDTEHFPAFRDIQASLDPLDLSLRVAAGTVKLSRGGVGDVATGRLALRLTKTNAVVSLDEFSVADLGGAAITATGSLDADRKLAAQGRLDARDLAPLLAIARQVAPGLAAESVVARAALLSPAHLDFGARATVGADGTASPNFLSATGSLGATSVSATLTPEAAERFQAAPVSAFVVLDAPDAGALMRQGGWGAAPTALLGHGHVEVTARGTTQTGFDTHAAASVGDTNVRFDGQLGSGSSQGRLSIKGANAAPLLRNLGLVSPPAGALWPWQADGALASTESGVTLDGIVGRFGTDAVSGSLSYAFSAPAVKGAFVLDTLPLSGVTALALGAPATAPPQAGHWWSDTRFPPGSSSLPPTQISVQVGALDLAASLAMQKAAFEVKLTPGIVAVNNLSGGLLGGRAGGAFTLRRDGAAASLTGQFKLDAVALNTPSLRGRLSGMLNVAGSGTSPDGIAASLAGDGALTLAAAAMPRLAPQSLAETAKAFDKEGVSVDDDTVREALLRALDRGALDLGTMTASATLAAGTLRVVDVRSTGPAFAASSEAAFNLRTTDLTVRTALTASEIPTDWKGDPPQVTITWRGPFASPSREVDSTGFTNGLASRAIARDQERIQLLQDDLRERAFFARRLRAIEAEQQAARDAEAAARGILGAPKPGDPRPAKPDATTAVPTPPLKPASRPAAPGAKPVQIQSPQQKLGEGSAATVGSDPSQAGRY